MGAELSWPCTGVKASKAISLEKKQEVSFVRKEITSAKGLRNKYSSRILMHQGDHLSPKRTWRPNDYQFTENQHEAMNDTVSQYSTTDQGPRIAICSAQIKCFKIFMNEIADSYENVKLSCNNTHSQLPLGIGHGAYTYCHASISSSTNDHSAGTRARTLV